MKIRIWTAIVDSGDGEHYACTFRTKEELISDLSITIDFEHGNEGGGFDDCGYYVQFSSRVFDTEGYEVVE